MDRRRAYERWAEQQAKPSPFALARALVERWPPHAKEPKPTAKSLSVTLTRWLENASELALRPTLRAVLSDVFDVEERMLFDRSVGAASRTPFRSFTALGSFDPEVDTPCDAPAIVERWSVDHLFAPGPGGAFADRRWSWFDLPPAGARAWISAPPGAGRSFVSRWHEFHRLQGRQRALVRRLAHLEPLDVSTLAYEGPLVLVVDVVGVSGDAVLSQLTRRDRVMVLAPAPMPVDVPDSTRSRWIHGAWSPDVGWRSAFTRWVAERLSRGGIATRLDPDRMIRWMNAVDPALRRFTTPDDILPLLDMAHRDGRDLASQFGPDLAKRIIVSRAADVDADGIVGAWLRRHASGTLATVVEKWWHRPQFPWQGSLARAEFEALLPTSGHGATAARRDEAHRLLADAERSPKKAAQLVREAREILGGMDSRRQSLEALETARLLHVTGDGRVELTPRWLADALAVAPVHADFWAHGEDSRTWGRCSLGEGRRRLVDDALARLEPAEFEALAERVLREFRRDDLGSVASLENVFVSVGDRAGRGWSPSKRCLSGLAKIAAIEMDLMAPNGHVPSQTVEPIAPRTRPGIGERGGARFLAACWSWSLHLPPVRVVHGLEWLFPGWTEPSLLHVPRAFRIHDGRGSYANDEEEMRGVGALETMATRALQTAKGTTKSSAGAWPLWLVAGAVCAANIDPASLIGFRYDLQSAVRRYAREVSKFIAEQPAARRAVLVEALWTAAFGTSDSLITALTWFEPPGVVRVEFDRSGNAVSAEVSDAFPASPVTRALLMSFPFERAIERARQAAPSFVEIDALLRIVPDAHRDEMAAEIARAHSGVSVEVVHIAERMQLRGALERLIDTNTEVPYAIAALWRIAPEAAIERSRAAYEAEGDVTWLGHAPDHHLGSVVKIVDDSQRTPSADLLRWLSRKVQSGGPAAEAIFAFISTRAPRSTPARRK